MDIFSLLILAAAELFLPVGQVGEENVFHERRYPGRVVAIQKVEVIPQVSGEILEVAFKNGTEIKMGDVLYRLDSVKYEAAVKNAESKVSECKAKVKYAELSYERHKKLLETRAVSLDEVDNALSLRDSSRSAYAAAQAELISACDDYDHCTIVAPISGKIGTTAKTKGNYVTAGKEPLVTLVQTSPVRVAFSISNRDFLQLFNASLENLKSDSIITLTLADGSEFAEEGEIEYYENVADEMTDTIRIYVVFKNAKRILKINTSVAVGLAMRNGVNMPAVPPTAILQDIQGPYVWVLDAQNIAHRRSVVRGDLKGDWLIIEKGLKKGENIVIEGAHRVRKGMKVLPFEKKRKQ